MPEDVTEHPNNETTDTPEGVVVFNIEKFREIYPELSALTDGQLNGYFDRACLFLDNTPKSIVSDLRERETLLFMLVCHIATLAGRGGGATGAVTSATEGSVSASFQPLAYSGNAQWYAQTACGAAFWQAIKKYIYGGRTYVQRTY